MKSQQLIEKFCKANELQIVELKYDRRLDYQYGEGMDDSAWIIYYRPLFVPYSELVYSEGYTALALIDELKSTIIDLKGA